MISLCILLISLATINAGDEVRKIVTFDYTKDVVGWPVGEYFTYEIPDDGCYNISATGASGNTPTPSYKYVAMGATATGVFKLKKGLNLTLLIGKHGIDGSGGGSFVFVLKPNNTRGDLYVAAGGASNLGCFSRSIPCGNNGQAGTKGAVGLIYFTYKGRSYEYHPIGGDKGLGAPCYGIPKIYCTGGGAGWFQLGCGLSGFPECEWKFNGWSLENNFQGAIVGGGFGGGATYGGGGYSGGHHGGGGSYVNKTLAVKSSTHQNLPENYRRHGSIDFEFLDDHDCTSTSS